MSLLNNILVKGRLAWPLSANDFSIKINTFGLQQGPKPVRTFRSHSISTLMRRGTAYQRHSAVNSLS